MDETRQDFKDADDWAHKYRPIVHGLGIGLRSNGTLFDLQGEDRKFVNRMEREFIWSVFHNGSLEYIQAGRHNGSSVVGFLVTDNPVLFADLNSKFAIGPHAVDWNAFEQPGKQKPAAQETIDPGNVSPATPEIKALPEELPPIVDKLDADPARLEAVPVSNEQLAPAPGLKMEVSKTSNSMKRLFGSFRRKAVDNQKIPVGKPVEVPCTAPAVIAPSDDLLAPPEPVPSPVMASLPPERQPYPLPETAPVPAADPVPVPERGLASPFPEMPPAIASATAPASDEKPIPKPARPVAVPRPRSRFARPKPVPQPFQQLAPSSTPAPDPLPTPIPIPVPAITAATILLKPKATIRVAAPPAPTPAADPLPSPDTSAAAKAMQVRVRYLPIGPDAAKLDFQVYGPWPMTTDCKDCGATGYSAGIVIGLVPCEECEGRGWNPPPGAPDEIVIAN